MGEVLACFCGSSNSKPAKQQVIFVRLLLIIENKPKTSPKSYTLSFRPRLSTRPFKKAGPGSFMPGPASPSHASCGDVSVALSREQEPDTRKLIAAATPAANMTPSARRTIASYTLRTPPLASSHLVRVPRAYRVGHDALAHEIRHGEVPAITHQENQAGHAHRAANRQASEQRDDLNHHIQGDH